MKMIPRHYATRAVLVLAFLVSVIAAPPTARAGKMNVVATLPSLGDIAREVGGDRVNVTSLCKGYEDPHYLQPKPSYSRTLRKAALLIDNGLELEVGWLPPLLDTARNPKLIPGSTAILDGASAVTNVLEVPTGSVDRSQGDIHPFGNPHVMLDPRNALAVVDLIARRLADLDPEGAAGYVMRADDYKTRLSARIEEWKALAAPLRGEPIVTYHKQWEYLAQWLGLNIIGYVESRPGIPPTPRHVTALIDSMVKKGVRIVLAATFMDEDAAGEVALKAGARLAVLPAEVGGADGTDSYIDLIDTIVHELAGTDDR